MSKNYPYGEVVFSDDGETLLYGWLDFEEVIKALQDYFMHLSSLPTLRMLFMNIGNSFRAETILRDIQDFITSAKVQREAL